MARTQFTRCQFEGCCNLLKPRPVLKRGSPQKFCSPAAHPGCSVPGCTRPHRAKGLCSTHYNRQGQYGHGVYVWDDRRRDQYHRRRQLIGSTQGERVLRAEIAQRDGYVCTGCHEPVDMNLLFPDPQSPSLDHTIPLSRGGQHTPENVTLMHLACNRDKGTKVA